MIASEQIQGFRGGEDVDQLVKFIEGEAASEVKKHIPSIRLSYLKVQAKSQEFCT